MKYSVDNMPVLYRKLEAELSETTCLFAGSTTETINGIRRIPKFIFGREGCTETFVLAQSFHFAYINFFAMQEITAHTNIVCEEL